MAHLFLYLYLYLSMVVQVWNIYPNPVDPLKKQGGGWNTRSSDETRGSPKLPRFSFIAKLESDASTRTPLFFMAAGARSGLQQPTRCGRFEGSAAEHAK